MSGTAEGKELVPQKQMISCCSDTLDLMQVTSTKNNSCKELQSIACTVPLSKVHACWMPEGQEKLCYDC